MPAISFNGVLIIAAIAVLVPVVLGFLPKVPLPGAVLEVIAGIVIGPSLLGWVHIDAPILVLSDLGLGMLLFLAGLLIFLPGFISDAVGLLLLAPPVRAGLQAVTAAWFVRRFTSVSGPGGVRIWTRSESSDRIVRGDVVREDEPPERLGS